VEEKYLQLRMPKDYAALLFVTPNYLNNLCVKALGTPAGEVIRNRLLLEAKRLLVNGGTTISQIAYQLNFTDHSHFSKFFKKSTGQSPEEFRKKHLELT
jgi:AraC-like DNA-binding protein